MVVAQEFMTDALALDMTDLAQVSHFTGWMQQRLPFLRVSMDGSEAVHLVRGGGHAQS